MTGRVILKEVSKRATAGQAEDSGSWTEINGVKIPTQIESDGAQRRNENFS